MVKFSAQLKGKTPISFHYKHTLLLTEEDIIKFHVACEIASLTSFTSNTVSVKSVFSIYFHNINITSLLHVSRMHKKMVHEGVREP